MTGPVTSKHPIPTPNIGRGPKQHPANSASPQLMHLKLSQAYFWVSQWQLKTAVTCFAVQPRFMTSPCCVICIYYKSKVYPSGRVQQFAMFTEIICFSKQCQYFCIQSSPISERAKLLGVSQFPPVCTSGKKTIQTEIVLEHLWKEQPKYL